MGEVFLAEDTAAHRRVAIKFLRIELGSSDLRNALLSRDRDARTARTSFDCASPRSRYSSQRRAVLHDGICGGEPIDEYCRNRKVSLDERMRLFHAVAKRLFMRTARAVVHLDLKPSNILVRADGTPKLLDFGIAKQLGNSEPAKQTQTQPRFTPAFAAPEQMRANRSGTYTDVYALGVVLYELLAGNLPYDLTDCTPSEVRAIITAEREPERPSRGQAAQAANKRAWRDLDVLCLKALKKSPQRRYRRGRVITRHRPLFKKRAAQGRRIPWSTERVNSSGGIAVLFLHLPRHWF